MGSVEVLRSEAELKDMLMGQNDHAYSPSNRNDRVSFYPAEDNCGQSRSEEIRDSFGHVTVKFWTCYIQMPINIHWRCQAGNGTYSQELKGEVLAADINLGIFMVLRAETGCTHQGVSMDGEEVQHLNIQRLGR